jgi:hypothetical protein
MNGREPVHQGSIVRARAPSERWLPLVGAIMNNY